MMFWYGAHWAFWQASLMWLGMIVFWALIIWAVYALITAARRPPQDRNEGRGNDARAILDERLARGDIDEAEYRRLRDLIGSGSEHEPAATGTAS